MQYGSLEYAYAEPIAQALVDEPAFRDWILHQTRFAGSAANTRLLHKEMKAARRASTWWRSHYTESCRCAACSGQETDLLALFEDIEGRRFALHFEVKQPTDRFSKDQAANYATRARCWVAKAPRAVLAHSDAATVLLCSRSNLKRYEDDASLFDTVITFEEIRERFHSIPLPETNTAPQSSSSS
jgi:hypothetical protein